MTLTVVAAADKTELDQLIADYLADIAARGRSRRTLRQAEYVLKSVLMPWCREQGITRIDQLDQKTLNAFVTRLMEQGGPRGKLARPSVHSYAGSVNLLLGWALKAGERKDQAKAHRPKLERRVLDVLDRKELRQLEEAGRNDRDRLLIALFAGSGIRLEEALGLRVEDLVEQGRARFIKVRGKGAKERLVPIRPELYRRLATYARRGRPRDVAGSYIFTSQRRRPGGTYSPRLSSRTVEDMVLEAAENAGFQGRHVTPHALRHAYATNALRGGMSPLVLQRILGHSDLSQISKTYSHLVVSDLFDAVIKLDRDTEE